MSENVAQRIQDKYPQMTKKQKMLADYMLKNVESMSFLTLRQLSENTGISEMTILHACESLGFSNFNELKYEFRKFISEHKREEIQRQGTYASILVPESDLGDKQRLLLEVCQDESDTISLLFSSLKIDDLLAAAGMMLDAHNIILCARGVSKQVTDFLSLRLATLGLPSVLVNTELTDSIQAALPLMGSSVLVVAVSMPDYYVMTTRVCQYARQQHCRILCFTDTSANSPVAQYGDLVLQVPTSSRLFANTPSALMIMANLVTCALTIEKSARKTSRYNAPQDFSRLFKP